MNELDNIYRSGDTSLMNTTPKQAAYLSTLEIMVSRQIAGRHELVCSMSDARKAIAGLRKMRALVATGWNA